jgi:T5SS/PEP-CTERM-associated repeat protein
MSSTARTALLAAAALVVALPARGEIAILSQGGFVETEAAFDLDGDGGVQPGEITRTGVVSDPGDGGTSETIVGAARGFATHSSTVGAGPETLAVASRGSCESTTPVATFSADDASIPGAGGNAGFSIEFTLTKSARFSLSGSVAVNPPIGREGGGSNRAGVLSSLLGEGDIEADDAFLDPQSDAGSVSGELPPGSYQVNAFCRTGAPRFPDGFPVGTGRWQLSLTVSEIEAGDVFTWIGPLDGAFADQAHWDPDGPATAGVPAFVPGERSDTARFRGAPARVDLASLAAASASRAPRGGAAQCAGPIQQTIGRLLLDRVQSVELANGTLALDALSLDERSLTVQDQGLLELRDAVLCARHASIGERGRPSFALVSGPGGVLQTLGSLAVGRGGEGTLRILAGGIASSEEVLLGDGTQRGSAVVSAATWETGNLAVGFRSSGDLRVESAGLLDTEQAILGLDLGAGRSAAATVLGAGSLWRFDGLAVGGRGTLEVAEGGRLERKEDDPTGGVFVGAPGDGEAVLLVNRGGEVETGALEIGSFGPGRMVVAEASDGNPKVDVGDALRIGTGPGAGGRVLLSGDPATDGFSIVSDTLDVGGPPGSRGELAVDFGGQLLTSTDARVGTDGGEGRVAILGGLASDLTRWQVSSSLTVGGEAPPALGTLLVRGATVEVGTAFGFGSLLVQPGGAIVGGAGAVLRVHGGPVTNHGAIVGPLTVDGRYDEASTGALIGALAGVSVSPRQLAARSPVGALAALAKPRRKPPLPAQGPVVFTGDTQLGGRLVLRFGNGFAPKQGDAFALIEAGGTVSGAFSEVAVEGLAPDAEFETTVADGAVTLTSLTDAVALPAVSVKAKRTLKEKKKRGAALTFKRTGDLAEALVVAYRVGGTATNGVDYRELSGAVEIPAGKRTAKVAIVPVRDGLAEPDETIEIETLPGEGYALGLASSATVALASAEAVAPR